ncbi:MAG: hypothetical protein EHM35_10520, partial [Planctomycetaceae bacterium]
GQHTFEVRAVDAAGNIDATPASFNWTVEAPLPPNTLTGNNVSVTVENASVLFATVTGDGLTTVDTLSSAPALPDGYLQLGAQYYDVSTTATYIAPVTVCFTYTSGSIAEPVRLLHYEGSAWVDVTTSSDPLAGQVCGEPGSLSPFAIATGTAAVVPDTMIDAGPPEFTASTSADFAFSSNDPLATFECALDDLLDWGSCTPTTSFTGLATGQHSLLVRAKNPAGLYDVTPASYTWTVTPVPDTFIDSAPTDPTESTNAVFEFSSDLTGVTFECAFVAADGELSFAPCSSPQAYTGLAFGEYSFLVRAVDAGGNIDPTPAEWDWEIGDIPAPVTLLPGPPNQTEDTNATFVFSADEPDPIFECVLDSGVFAPCVSPVTYSGLSIGTHLFQVRILNPNAVAEAPISSYQWTIVDLSLPDTVIDSGPSAQTGSAVATFNFHASELNATFECSLNGSEFGPCTSPAEYNDLLPGSYTFSVRAIDPGGNIDPSPASHSWTVVTQPVATILSGPDSESNVRSATFTFSADQDGSTFECSLDLGPYETCVSPHSIDGLADGSHQFAVQALTVSGIASVEPAVYDWVVEASAPETTILSGPAATTTATSATFTFSANEASVLFECALDGAAFAECFTPHGVASLSFGEHTLLVRATDNAGNVEQTPASYTWMVQAPPETTINAIASGSGVISFIGNGVGGQQTPYTYECRLDNGEFTACSSPVT